MSIFVGCWDFYPQPQVAYIATGWKMQIYDIKPIIVPNTISQICWGIYLQPQMAYITAGGGQGSSSLKPASCCITGLLLLCRGLCPS